MRRSLPLALTFSLTLLSVGRLEAQDLGGASLGRRVLVWAPNPTVATVIQADSAVFVQSRTGEGAVIGAGLGGLIGGIIGAAAYDTPDCDRQADLFCLDFGPAMILGGAVIGMVSGAVIGAAIGSQMHVERRQRAPRLADLRLAAAPSREGMRLGVSASF